MGGEAERLRPPLQQAGSCAQAARPEGQKLASSAAQEVAPSWDPGRSPLAKTPGWQLRLEEWLSPPGRAGCCSGRCLRPGALVPVFNSTVCSPSPSSTVLLPFSCLTPPRGVTVNRYPPPSPELPREEHRGPLLVCISSSARSCPPTPWHSAWHFLMSGPYMCLPQSSTGLP